MIVLDPLIPHLRYNPAKGLQGKRADKMAWPCILSSHPNILNDFETRLNDMATDDPRYYDTPPPPQ
jgi:hypothetical protein